MNWNPSTAGALALAAALLPSVAQAAPEVVVWHAYRGAERSALEGLVKQFNGSHDALKIKAVAIPYDAFADKITAAVPRGKGPDVFIFAHDRIGDWASKGVIEPVDFWMDKKLEKAFMKSTLKAMTYDDAIYGLPMSYKMIALIYNKKLVKKPPKTTDELIALAKKLTNKKKQTYGLAYEAANFYYQAMWMQGFGGRVFDKKKRPTLDTKAVVDSMAFAQRLANQEGIMPEEASGALVTSLFNQGKAAMVINGPWFLGEVDKKVKYGVAKLPVISEVGKPARPFFGAEGVIMSAKTKDKKAAFAVMKFLTSTEAGTTMALQARQPSARKDVYKNPKVANDPLLKVFRAQLNTSLPMPNTPRMRLIWTPASTAMNQIINGEKAPGPVMKETQAELKKLMKGARK